jgi:hypothetical protein
MNNENNSLSTLKTGNIEKLQYICSAEGQQKNKLRKKEERQERK